MSQEMQVEPSQEVPEMETFDLVDSLNKVNSIVAGQEIKLSTEQALVQEVNNQIDSLNAQIEELKKQTKVALQDYAEKENEFNYIALLKKSMIRSIELSRKSSIFLEEQKWHYQEKIQQCRRQQYDVLTEHYHKFDTFKRTITTDLPLYEKLEKLKAEKKKLFVNFKNKESFTNTMKNARKKNCEIKRQIFNADIVKFVKACKAYKANQEMFAEIKKLEILQSSLEGRYKELQKINAEREVEESTNCLSELKELDEFENSSPMNFTFRKPTVPPLPTKERYSLLKETSFFEKTTLVIRNFKTRTVLLKRKSSDSDGFGLKPEKLRNNGPKIKILEVQTVTPEQKLQQSKLPIKNVEEIKGQENENDANLQNKGSEEVVRNTTGNLQVFSKDLCTPVTTSQIVVNTQANSPVTTSQFVVNTQASARNDVVVNQDFDMITDEQDGFDITSNDLDNEQFLSSSHDPVGGFVMSPPAKAMDEEPFFRANTSDQFFKLF